MCRNDKKLLKYQLSIELYGNVGPFELSESAISEHNAAEEAHKEAKHKYDQEMLTYKFDYDIYEKKNEEYENQQNLIK
jgi:hypothetical protein